MAASDRDAPVHWKMPSLPEALLAVDGLRARGDEARPAVRIACGVVESVRRASLPRLGPVHSTARDCAGYPKTIVADILMTHVLDAGTRQEMLKPHPNLLAYRARCTDRSAWKRTVDAYNERVEAA
jgi:hypothetical protein